MINPEIERINSLVRKYLDVYEFRITPDHLEFYFTYRDEKEFGENFEKLRVEMKKINAIPMVKKKGGEYVLLVLRNPKRHFFSIWINLGLLILTILSTIWVGMGYYTAYYGSGGFWHDFMGGLIYFSVPLLTILGCHEMGHYFAAKKHNIAASLPFFIPAPTMLGTLGAFISIREPIPDKKSLIDVGLSGPIVGFLVAIPVTILGLILGNMNPPHVDTEAVNTYMIFNVPLIYEFLEWLFPSSNFVHPVSMAGWVGFVVTAINLFPIGQLDGGHAVRAIFGDKAKYISYGFAALLIGLGFLYPGWLIFGILVIFLGLRHPPPLNDIVKLDKKRYAIFFAALLVFAVTFVPIPVEVHQMHENVNINAGVDSSMLILGTNMNKTILRINVTNQGEMRENITLRVQGDFEFKNLSSYMVFSIDPGKWKNLESEITTNTTGNKTISLELRTKTNIVMWKNITVSVFMVSSDLYFSPSSVHGSDFNVTLENKMQNRTVHFISLNHMHFHITNYPMVLKLQANESVELHILVLGTTILAAVDYENYEIALLYVTV